MTAGISEVGLTVGISQAGLRFQTSEPVRSLGTFEVE